MIADLKIMQIFGIVGPVLGVEAGMLVDASGTIASGSSSVESAVVADGMDQREFAAGEPLADVEVYAVGCIGGADIID